VIFRSPYLERVHRESERLSSDTKSAVEELLYRRTAEFRQGYLASPKESKLHPMPTISISGSPVLNVFYLCYCPPATFAPQGGISLRIFTFFSN
jgi:hypothetical protein